MKIGIISDIEGNDRHLSAVLDCLSDCGHIFNLGDSVGDKGDSDRVITMLNRKRIRSVAGNHDLEVVLSKSVGADRYIAETLQSSSELYHPKVRLNADSMAFIKALKLTLKARYKRKLIAFCHSIYGRLADDLYFEYVNAENACDLLTSAGGDMVFVGHSHRPSIVVVKKTGNASIVKLKNRISLSMDDRYKYIVNPGSIGAPRLKGLKYSYATLDLENYTLSVELV